MKLKSLEIEGFKSFADKTLIPFDGRISGIVGPNGCGKSNVVDAIRWVLGEQSSKNLRGKSMDDVIFSGTSERSQANAASVELTLITEGRDLPEPYASVPEISVGRKLFRDGMSEYYINRQPARLKDVRDLFLGSGVGVNAYSIIEQGRVGEIVTAKPEDRRRIVEEAAGISRFQMRKAAAERRMEATTQNLLRLKDVLSELERQKGSLERQARKAEKFKGVRDEWRALDLKLAARDHAAFLDSEKKHFEELKKLDGVLTQTQATLTERENNFELKRLDLTGVAEDLSRVQEQGYRLSNELSLSEAMLSHKKNDEARHDREHVEAVNQLASIRKELSGAQNSLNDLLERAVDLDLNLTAGEQDLAFWENELSRTQADAAQTFSDLAGARADEASARQNLARLTTKKQSTQNRLEELAREKATLTDEINSLSERLSSLINLIHRSQSGLSDVRQLKLELDERSTMLESQTGQLETELEAERQSLSALKEGLLQKKSRLDSLKELERNFEGYQDGPRSLLKKRSEGGADYVLGSVADFIETEPEYENALSAVLGERTQGLVVQQMGECLDATEVLRGLGTGRSSFLALGSLNVAQTQVYVRELPAHSQETGVRGPLSRFVRFREGYESLKSTLLGDYLLVETLPQAIQLWQNHRCPVVTPDGDLITQDGVLSAGSPELTSRGLLEKKREIKEITLLLEDLVNQVKSGEEKCFDMTRKLKTLKAELDDMQKHRHVEDIKIASHEKDIQLVLSQRDGLEENRSRLSVRILSVGDEIDRLDTELAELTHQEQSEELRLSGALTLIASEEGEEERFKSRIAECSENLTQARIQTASFKVRTTEAKKEQDRLSAEVLHLTARGIACEQKIILAQKLAAFFGDRVGFLHKNLARLLEHKTRHDRVLDEAKNRHADLEKAVLDLELEIRELRGEVSRLKDAINVQSLGLSETRSQLTRLKDQVYERHQLFIHEIFNDHLDVQDGFDEAEARLRAEDLRQQLARAGSVNLEAIDELAGVAERFEFLTRQKQDLDTSLDALVQAIAKINETTRVRFRETFDLINEKFAKIFPKLFNGGEAYLKLTDPDNILTSGVEIIAQPPGKKLQNITLLSGGEKALTAVSLLFAIFLIKPSPFCLLDEVDAPLDDANVDRYNDIVSEMSERTQFIVITHNKRTMQMTRTLFGVTMQKPGVSQVVSVNLQ